MEPCVQIEAIKELDKRLREVEKTQEGTIIYVKEIKDDIRDMKEDFKEFKEDLKKISQDDITQSKSNEAKTWQPIVLELIKIIGQVVLILAAVFGITKLGGM
jgi:hypothetical protein